MTSYIKQTALVYVQQQEMMLLKLFIFIFFKYVGEQVVTNMSIGVLVTFIYYFLKKKPDRISNRGLALSASFPASVLSLFDSQFINLLDANIYTSPLSSICAAVISHGHEHLSCPTCQMTSVRNSITTI